MLHRAKSPLKYVFYSIAVVTLVFSIISVGELSVFMLSLTAIFTAWASSVGRAHLIWGQTVIIVSRLGYILYDAHFGNQRLLASDIERFLRRGAQRADDGTPFWLWQGELSGDFYDLFVSRIFRVFAENSAIHIQILTAIAFTLFISAAYDIAVDLGIPRKNAVYSLVVFAFIPSMLFFSSSGLREPWMLMLLAHFMLLGMRIVVGKPLSIAIILRMLLTVIGLMLFHKAFNLIMPLLLLQIPLMLVLKDIKQRGFRFSSLAWSVAIIVGLAAILLTPSLQVSALQTTLDNEALTYIDSRRNASIVRQASSARAHYGITLNTNSFIGLLGSYPIVLVYYLATPFPWQVSSLVDIYAFFEASFSLLMLAAAIVHWRKSKNSTAIMISYVLIACLIIAGIHAAGTINYGTAIRHRLMSHWGLFIIGGSYLIDRYAPALLKGQSRLSVSLKLAR